MSSQSDSGAAGSGRSAEDRAIDEAFNEMVEKFLGPEGLDLPMKDQLDTTDQGVVSVVTDPSDPGDTLHYLEVATDELDQIAIFAANSMKLALEVFPDSDDA